MGAKDEAVIPSLLEGAQRDLRAHTHAHSTHFRYVKKCTRMRLRSSPQRHTRQRPVVSGTLYGSYAWADAISGSAVTSGLRAPSHCELALHLLVLPRHSDHGGLGSTVAEGEELHEDQGVPRLYNEHTFLGSRGQLGPTDSCL